MAKSDFRLSQTWDVLGVPRCGVGAVYGGGLGTCGAGESKKGRTVNAIMTSLYIPIKIVANSCKVIANPHLLVVNVNKGPRCSLDLC
jgi:hypothetical protein